MAYHLLEEVYELIDAIYEEDVENVQEEMGDVLFQILFIYTLYEEKSLFSIDDVIKENIEKMVRRHPHVFEKLKVNSISEIKENWEKIKKKEKGNKKLLSILDKVPRSTSPIVRAYTMSKKTAKLGFEWETANDVIEQVKEEIVEFQNEIKKQNRKEAEIEFGDILFSLINTGRFLKINPEIALNEANKKFERRFKNIENRIREEKIEFKDLSREDIDTLWEEAKKDDSNYKL